MVKQLEHRTQENKLVCIKNVIIVQVTLYDTFQSKELDRVRGVVGSSYIDTCFLFFCRPLCIPRISSVGSFFRCCGDQFEIMFSNCWNTVKFFNWQCLSYELTDKSQLELHKPLVSNHLVVYDIRVEYCLFHKMESYLRGPFETLTNR